MISPQKTLKRYSYLVADKINRLWNGRSGCNPEGKPVYEADWDNLIILDAARYDIFDQVNWLEGDLKSWSSLGTWSRQFVSCNFKGKKCHDLVIISANGYYQEIWEKEGFEPHYMDLIEPSPEHPVQERFFDAGRAGWCMPGPITEQAERAAEEFPNKRLLIHYHQPHSPYIGETGREYFDELPHKLANDQHYYDSSIDDILRESYIENMEIAISAVEDLLLSLTGKTVITADHGELLGERGFPAPRKYYGHPPGFYVEELVRVPWFTIHSGERKEVEPEPPRPFNLPDSEEVEKRLRELGYK